MPDDAEDATNGKDCRGRDEQCGRQPEHHATSLQQPRQPFKASSVTSQAHSHHPKTSFTGLFWNIPYRLVTPAAEFSLALRRKAITIQLLFRDGDRSSKVEPQIVILVVAGSNPVGHPIFFWSTSSTEA